MPRAAFEATQGAAAATAACPFCSLLCDDLRLRARPDHGFDIEHNGCRRAAADFARPPLEPVALVAGKPVTLQLAVAAAARLLKRARHPLLGGLATDVDGIRAAVDLAERCGASLDHLHGDTLSAMTRVLQTRGWFTTTLSEVRNRADFVVMIGLDLDARHEAFLRRCVYPEHALDAARLAERKVVYLGATPPTTSGDIEILRTRGTDTHAAMEGLLALLKGEKVTARRFGGVPRDALARLATALLTARYAALVFAPGALGPAREPAIATVFELVDVLNRTTRAAALPLGGDDGGQTAQSTCAWLTGYPLRIQCGRIVDYDPVGLSTAALLARGAIDALLWVDAFGRNGQPPTASPADRTIVLSSTRDAAAEPAAVFIAVGTPGLDHAARLVRTDAVVSVALAGQRSSGLPSVASVLAAITARL